VWDLTTNKETHHVLTKEINLDVRFVSFLNEGKTFVTAGGYGPARFWDTATAKEVSPIKK
jgi:WD40 repeat protein